MKNNYKNLVINRQERFNYFKDDFFPTGSAESSPLFYYACSVGASLGANALLIIINNNGVSKWFVEKIASERLMKKWLSLSISELNKRFDNWKKEWVKVEPALFDIIKSDDINWKKQWERVDKIGIKLWKDTYFVETIDPFAEELEKQILFSMEKCGLDRKDLFELISVQEPTRTQMAVIDFKKYKNGKFSLSKYLKKYWYFDGSWVGGELLTKKMLTNDFLPNPVHTNYKVRRILQKELETVLDESTKKLVNLLRVFTLWREERKAYVQMLSVIYAKIGKKVSKEEKVDYIDIQWSRPDEIRQLKIDSVFAKERRKNSVFLIAPKFEVPRLLVGKETKKITKEFVSVNRNSHIYGSIACQGVVVGRARVVLKEHQFGKFQKGEVLITTSTRPEFVPIMSMASAIITDEGGLTSHAAIIARELRIPCIIGTKHATEIFSDGDLVKVDADKGVISIVK